MPGCQRCTGAGSQPIRVPSLGFSRESWREVIASHAHGGSMILSVQLCAATAGAEEAGCVTQGGRDDGAAMHAGVQPAADQDMPSSRHLRHGRHVRPDPCQEQPPGQRGCTAQGTSQAPPMHLAVARPVLDWICRCHALKVSEAADKVGKRDSTCRKLSRQPAGLEGRPSLHLGGPRSP